MKPLLTVLILSLATTVGAVFYNPSHIEPYRDKGGDIHCTAFSINAKKGYFMSAEHCLEAGAPYLFGMEAEKVAEFPNLDIIIMKAVQSKPALKLSKVPPKVGDKVSVLGYANGWELPTYFEGVIAAQGFQFLDGWRNPSLFWTLYDLNVIGGQSGAAIVDKDGNVVGVMQFHMAVGRDGVSGGPRWEDLVAQTSPYWEH